MSPDIRLVLLLAAALTGTAPPAGAREPRPLSVVASLYPLADWAAVVGGSRVAVSNLTPAGADPHDLEPTPGDLRRVLTADVVLTLGPGFQPAVDTAVAGPPGRQVRFAATEWLRGAPAGGAPAGAPSEDPHVWLDPLLAKAIVTGIADALGRADPAGRAAYEAGARAYAARLDALHAAYGRTLATCRHQAFITSHAAFGHLAARYGLTQQAISGVSPGAGPTPRRLAELTRLARERGVRYVFAEAPAGRRAAETLARAAGAHTLVLNPLEGLTSAELAARKDYLAVMEENLRSLAVGLECRAP